ncbi:hypothetical protein FLAG1_11211 [Fusarium langsethiae]|uniref:Uncharacterized protein n=1 Tax=Fusarium langsethiae TaxID=179993 RepID=A0A0N0DB04_FUSLA|nr:hypothetical protein FLAG1_11211 [Fusarium langsethiae]GKU08417.1 unnamed protein product [Fusarium langsethiae]GKU10322.1 unnamed protein product [Fusarium langsethiae]
MKQENRQNSMHLLESSRKDDKLAIPVDEMMLLSSHEPEDPPTMPSSESLEGVSKRSGFIRQRFQNLCNQWDRYKLKPWNMCLFLLVGTSFALGHHFFYLMLDGKMAAEQSLMLRYGTILAFCAKASFGTAASMAFHQRAWLVIRHKMARIDTVDSIFTANTNIVSLLTWSSIKTAKIVSLWNTTAPGDDINSNDPSDFDYWTATSVQWYNMVAYRVALSNEPLIRNETGEEVCSPRWNCSYVLSFVAPGYKCEELASGINSTVQNLGDNTPPFNTSVLAPIGNMTYYAKNDMGEYENPQILSGPGGRPKQKPPYSKNLGAFRTEPIMWIGYCTVEDYSKLQPTNRDHKDWYKAYTPVIIGCEHYEVNYTIQFDYVGGVQSHKVLRRDYLRKVVDTTLTSEMDPDKRLKDRTMAVPEKNYIYPSDVENYRLTAAYHSLGNSLRGILNGTNTIPYFDANSQIFVTPLVDRINYLLVRNFGDAIRNMYENMIISILATPSSSVVSWASNGRPSGLIKGGLSTAFPCRKQQYINVFRYNKAQLLTVYAAYQEEGRMRDMKPSSIITASRASDLHDLGAKGDVRIGYGLVQEAGRSVRSFGVEGIVTQPQRLETE